MDFESASASTPNNEPSLLDLNDDCLLHTIEYLNLDDLITIADVCTRLRENAQTHFAQSKFKNLSVGLKNRSLKCVLLTCMEKQLITNVLQIFGSHLSHLNVCLDFGNRFHTRLFELIHQYCFAAPIDLAIRKSRATDENEMLRILRPLFSNLRRMEVRDCHLSERFISVLAECALELRELSFEYGTKIIINQSIHGFSLKFRKLQSIAFASYSLNMAYVQHFLKCNPQLKHIRYFEHSSSSSLQSIAGYITQMESVNYWSYDEKSAVHGKFFGLMSNLKSLNLFTNKNSGIFLQSILREIAATNVPLEHLNLVGMVCSADVNPLVDEFVKLKNLKSLCFTIDVHLTFPNLINVCQHLSELSEIYIHYPNSRVKLMPDQLVKIIRIGENLKNFEVFADFALNEKITINQQFVTDLATIVNKRQQRTHLKMILCNELYEYDGKSTNDVVNAQEKLLSLYIQKTSFENHQLFIGCKYLQETKWFYVLNCLKNWSRRIYRTTDDYRQKSPDFRE